MSKIGIMGGTFNPIHKGHLTLAQSSYEQFHLDRILVIPNKLPTYKDTDELLDSRHRSRMVKLAIAPFPYMDFSDMELKRAGATYTADTLLELRRRYPDDTFYFILGGDSLLHLQEWRRYKDILTLAVILCAGRGDADTACLEQVKAELLRQVPEARIYFLDTPDMDISSTALRDSLYTDAAMRQWIPEDVYQYIINHRLYAL